jgi:hypothetical protein
MDQEDRLGYKDIGALADAYADEGRWVEAREAYQKAIAADPTDADLYNSLGTVYEVLGQPEEAEHAYLQAVALDPQEAVIYYNLGVMYQAQKRAPEAIRAYEQCIQYATDPKERADAERRLARLTSRTPTGQSRLAYRLAGAFLSVSVLAGLWEAVRILISNPSFLGDWGSRPVDLTLNMLFWVLIPAAFVLFDLAAVIGLFLLQGWARGLAIGRVVAGIIVVAAQVLYPFGDLPFASFMPLTAIVMGATELWRCGALILLLTGRSKPWRLAMAGAVFALFVSGLFCSPLSRRVFQPTLGSIFQPSVVVTLAPEESANVTPESLEMARQVLQSRLEAARLTRATVAVAGDRLRVTLADRGDVMTVAQLAGEIGVFVFFDSDVVVTPGTSVPTDAEIVLTNVDISQAGLERDTVGRYLVVIEFTSDGTRKLAEYTQAHIGRYLVVARDGWVLFSPQVRSSILEGRASISGMDETEALLLTAELNGGPLPFRFVVETD